MARLVFTDIFALLACTVLVALLWLRNHKRRREPHPPGPPGLPFIGNLRELPNPRAFPWSKYMNWSKQYNSDIIRLNALGVNLVVANSMEVARELLDKRSAIYSDRPRMVMLNELCGFGRAMGFSPYNAFWKESRKMARQQFHSTPVKRFRPVEVRSTHRFLLGLLQNPDQLMENLRHLAGATIMSIAYDIEVQPHDDPFVQTAEEAATVMAETADAGSYLVDTIPILKHVPDWFPGASFKKQARVWRTAVDKLFADPYDVCRRRWAAGELGDCAAKSMMDTFRKHAHDPSYTDMLIEASLGSLYVGGFAGGADTTVSALGTFFLAMTLNPDVQGKARTEIDKVVGPHRLPDFHDQPSLPYIDAIVKETIRWRPVIPLDIPHRLTEDDIYNGYYLPKGSLIVANTWAMLHDEEAYTEPSRFNPDRFLKPDGTTDLAVRDPSSAAFGFGRRICPGRFMALDSIWIAIACVLALFEIKKAVGEDGREITPDAEYHLGFLCHPKPFPCVIKPRSNEHQQLVRELAEHAF
ncbi:cytochrome P450 [Pilatotrama ljubarskyi]|nr:cytochrome P450 [Pilatotrama ljubarskyi]